MSGPPGAHCGGSKGAVHFARGRVVGRRLDWIAPYVRSGRVLDLGCIDERHPERFPFSLHLELRAINSQIVGADVDAGAVAAVRRLGFDVLLGDAETDDFGGPYDVVFAGELVEHLNNPGRFLDNIRRHLKPGGLLLLSTPNPFYANQFAKILKHGRPQVHRAHRAWFSPETLQVLLESHGFELVDFAWVQARRGLLRRLLVRLRPYWAAGFGVAARPTG